MLAIVIVVMISFGDWFIFFFYDECYWVGVWMLFILVVGLWLLILVLIIDFVFYVLGKF